MYAHLKSKERLQLDTIEAARQVFFGEVIEPVMSLSLGQVNLEETQRGLGVGCMLGRGTQRFDDDSIEPAEMLFELDQAIVNTPLLRRLPANTALYRGRTTSVEEAPADHVALGSPPPERTRTTRMSPAGISMFYGAEDVPTVLEELRPGGARSSANGVSVADGERAALPRRGGVAEDSPQ